MWWFVFGAVLKETIDTLEILLASSADGIIYGIDEVKGNILWTLNTKSLVSFTEKENVISSSTDLTTEINEQVRWLIDPSGPGYLYLQTSGKPIKKFPFSIKEIVAKSPWKLSETLFLGKKVATFLAVHLKTGELLNTFHVDNLQEIPPNLLSNPHVVLIGRTDYFLSINSKFKNSFNLYFSEFTAGIHELKNNDSFENSFISMTDGTLKSSNWETKFPNTVCHLFKVFNEKGENYLNSIPLISIRVADSSPSILYDVKVNELTRLNELSLDSLRRLNEFLDTPKLISDKAENEPKEFSIYFYLFAGVLLLILWVIKMRKGKASNSSIQISDEILGYGSQGTIVFKGTFGNRQVAIKRLLIDFYEIADHEISLLQQSDHHPNVIRYYSKEKDDKFMFIVLELCIASLEDLFYKDTLTQDLKKQLKPKTILREIIMGIAHLHDLNIVHRDLKPQNVLITPSLKVVISDFGVCKKLKDDQISFQLTISKGTLGWRAPECILSDEIANNTSDNSTANKVTKSIDIFAAGCIFYYVLSQGQHPYGDSIHRESNISFNRYNLDKIDSNYEAKDLIESMIDRIQENRPSASEILKHPYFWNSQKRLNFLQDLSDRLEADTGNLSGILESKRRIVCTFGNWHKQMDPEILNDLLSFRHYSGHSLKDLLRAIRNKVFTAPETLEKPLSKFAGQCKNPIW